MAITKKVNEHKVNPSVGIIMPISVIDSCTAEHWTEVKLIITESVKSIIEHKFDVKLVSESEESGVIQKHIVQNVYSSDIVICDVSCKNPNVMFELGMRLAFDKPTVIIKDDVTGYSFDTGIIEHIPYPRDLRYYKINDFKGILADKVLKTYNATLSDPEHSTFLKNFGKFKVASISETEIPANKLIIDMLTDLQSEVRSMKRGSNPNRDSSLTVVKEQEQDFTLRIEMLEAENRSIQSELVGVDNELQNIDKKVNPEVYTSLHQRRERLLESLNFTQTKLNDVKTIRNKYYMHLGIKV